MPKVVGQVVVPVSAMNDGEFPVELPAAGKVLSASFVPIPGGLGVLMWVLSDTSAVLVSRRFLLLDIGKPTLLLDELAYIASPTIQTPEGLGAAHLFELVKAPAPVFITTGR